MSLRARFGLLLMTCACADERDGKALADAAPPAADEPDATLAQSDAVPNEEPSHYVFPCLHDRVPTRELTFEAVYIDIFCKGGCTNPYCHGSTAAWQDLDMTTVEGTYRLLVDHAPGKLEPVARIDTCRTSELLRVKPYAPEESLLYLKVANAAPCGTVMPPPESGLRSLPAEDVDQIRRWILAGAPFLAADAGTAQGTTEQDASAD